MNLKIDRSFEKDTDKIHDPKILHKVAVCIETVMAARTVKEIPHLKKLHGFRNHFRIRIGDYRIGLRILNEVIIFERFLSRKDIYKYYP